MYTIQTKVIKRGSHEKKIPVIIFDDPKKDIISEFLMTDAPLLNFKILRDIKEVLNEREEKIVFTGQRTAVSIKKNQSEINDLFAGIVPDRDLYASYVINTTKLKDLTEMWQEERKNLK